MTSYKSNIDRTNLFDVPSYSKMISIVKTVQDKPWVKPALAILIGTGCRAQELLYLKRGNIKFIDYNNKEIANDKLLLAEVATIQFNFHTEKNRKNKHRIVPLIKNEMFFDLVEIVVDYCSNFKYDDTLLFPYTRVSLWYAIKRVMGKDFFPHYLRHMNVTNDTRAGVSTVIQKTKYGWTDLRPHSVYSHLNYVDVLNEQQKVFGEASKKVVEVINEHVKVREDYNKERDFKPEPISETRPAYVERTNHPEPPPEITNEDIILEKAIMEIKELPPTEKSSIVVESKPVDTVEKTVEKRKPGNLLFKGPELPKSDTEGKQFAEIDPKGKDFFKDGTIVKDKVVLVTHNKETFNKLKNAYDPDKVIPLKKDSEGYKTRIDNLRKAQFKRNQDQLVSIV
jgi:hypothetical protein